MMHSILRTLAVLVFVIGLASRGDAQSADVPPASAAVSTAASPPPTHTKETDTPATPTAPAATITMPENLQQPIVDLTKSLTRLADKKAEPEEVTTTLGELLKKLGELIGAIVGAWAAYKAGKEVPWLKEHRELIALVGTSVSLVVLFYVLSSVVTNVLVVVCALLVLLIALLVAAAHLLSFIDSKYPDARDAVLDWFADSSASKSTQKFARDNLRNLRDWLESVLSVMRLSSESTLTLSGALCEGFEVSEFTLVPNERIVSHWELMNDRMVIPVGVALRVRNSETNLEGEILNIQMGLLVVRIDEELHFKAFSMDGFHGLGVSFMKHYAERIGQIAKTQKSIAAEAEIFKAQSL
jgi:hypothetical protein